MNHLTNAAPDSMILKESDDLIPNPKIQEWRNTDLVENPSKSVLDLRNPP